MSEWVAEVFERRFSVPPARTVRVVHGLGIILAALLYSAVATLVMSINTIFVDQSLADLQVGDIAPFNIDAPTPRTWISEVLTESGRQNAINNVDDVYDLPEPTVARQQTQLARQILDYINNVRRDPYGVTAQKVDDLNQITALDLDEGVMLNILELDEETWRSIDEQIVDVLERVMQQSIRESDLSSVVSRLPTQVSVRFNPAEAGIITSVVEDLVRPNTFVNEEQTEAARERAAAEFSPVRRSFAAGQRVVNEGQPITELDYEALQQLNLLEVSPVERRAAQMRSLAQAFMVSILTMVVIGLFIARFAAAVLDQPRFILLAAALYLLFLMGARFVGGDGPVVYIYPTAAMALLFVAIIGSEVAIVGTLGLALMVSFMLDQRLELAALVGIGGMIGTLTLRKAERLNSYFFAGLMVGLANTVVIVIFNLGAVVDVGTAEIALPQKVLFGAANGVLAAASAVGLMYLVTVIFNLPTGLRMVELSQPNQPLLQRLLRDAPGTYQHSLQVANLSEQAASAIGANAELVRVAALYHDIGKGLNPHFFVENQADGVNPHDEMGDPYRSADIIISHVTEGDKLARQNRLPTRIRDFIMEHHGTTRVEYFYRQALATAENADEVDSSEFTYPGPIPQSKETAIMMLADSCESTVRARRPSNRQEIQDIIQGIIDARNKDGQLDESGLTSNDIKTIRTVFVDMLQAVFHPRINYPSASPSRRKKTLPEEGETAAVTESKSTRESAKSRRGPANGKAEESVEVEKIVIPPEEVEDSSPMPDVPPLPRRSSNADDDKPEEPES